MGTRSQKTHPEASLVRRHRRSRAFVFPQPGTDPKASSRHIVDKPIAAVQALTSANLDRFIGVDDQLEPEVVQALWDASFLDVEA